MLTPSARLSSWGVAREYGFTDVDGSQPDWGTWFRENVLRASPAAEPGRAPRPAILSTA
jgi:hypothetical protein